MRIKKETLEKTAIEYAGEESLPIVEYLLDKEDINEFVIAQKTKTEIHFVRHIMYKLNNANLATYIRKKDRIKGWYISYWTLNIKRFKELFSLMQVDKLKKLKLKLRKEQQSREGLYICPNLCTRMSFEEAMDLEFKCPECGRLLNVQDNTRTIEHLKELIVNMEAVIQA